MRKLVLGLVAATALAGASAANATLYAGSTTGCFGAACTPNQTNTTMPGSGLTFRQGTFSQQDSNGFVGIGSNGTDTFGLFDLTGASFNYTSAPTLFTLLITFTQPTGTAGANTFSSTITGSVSGDGIGGVFVNFDNTAHAFTSNAGPFLVSLNDFSISAGSVGTPITGQINAVPEPATWGMMLLGFAGIGMALRRRRRPALAQIA